ncbi:MAG: TetR/AcrR family transcriptional regulator, partial [Nocardioidaceae bacterium]
VSPETGTAAGTPTPTRRERNRAATIAEIKEIGLRLMRESGTTDVRFSEIAREMGMTAPGLYRYFTGSEELLTELIVDAFDDLGTAVADARDAQPEGDLWGRLLATSAAYRDWARREPQQFSLLFGMPVPGYCAPDDGPTTEAAKRAMGQLQTTFIEAARLGKLGPPLLDGVDDAFVAGVNEAHKDDHLMPDAWDGDRAEVADALTPATMQAMLMFWAALHGFVTLHAYGHFEWLGEEAQEALFRSTVEQGARCAGLPTAP